MADKNPLHLVWDWSGTVLDDFDVGFRATNSSFHDVGLPQITTAVYRELLRTPVRGFYAAVLGRELSDDECGALERGFHKYYRLYEQEVALSPGLPQLLHRWNGSGRTQSLLSLHPHDKLVPAVEQHGLTPYFTLIQGTTPPYPERKAAHLTDHLARLHANPASVVVIGDLVDDAYAAQRAGVRAVLYSGGFGARAALVATGVPVVDSLAEAVELTHSL